MSPTKQPSLNLFKWEQWYHLCKRKIYVLPRRIGCVKCRKSEIPSKAKAFYNCITYDLSFSNGPQKMYEYTSLQDSLALGTFYHAFCTFYHVFCLSPKKSYYYMFFCCNNWPFVGAPLCRPRGPAKRRIAHFYSHIPICI